MPFIISKYSSNEQWDAILDLPIVKKYKIKYRKSARKEMDLSLCPKLFSLARIFCEVVLKRQNTRTATKIGIFSGTKTAIFIICNNHKNYTSVVLYFILSFMVSSLFYSCSLFLLPPLLCVLLSLVLVSFLLSFPNEKFWLKILFCVLKTWKKIPCG